MAIAETGFERKSVALPGGAVPYYVGGTGLPVLYLADASGFRVSPALRDLASRYRFFAPVLTGAADDLAKLAASFADAAIGEGYDLIGHGAGGDVAVALTLLHPGKVGQLVLESPQDIFGADEHLSARVGEIGCLTLILRGTKDGAASLDNARRIKSRIRRSHLIFVYDSGDDIEFDRPARFTALVGDFLDRAEGFLVNWTGHVSDAAGAATG